MSIFREMQRNNRTIIFLIGYSFITLQFFSPTLFAQDIQKLGPNQFQFQERSYAYGQMDSIFRLNTTSYEYYLQANHYLNKSKRWRNTSLIGLGVGIGGFALARANETYKESFAVGVLLMLSGAVVFPVSAIIAINSNSRGKKLQSRSLDSFNQAYGKHSFKNRSLEVHVIIRNGLGVQLRF